MIRWYVYMFVSLQACKHKCIHRTLHIVKLVFIRAYLKKYLQALIIFPIIVDYVFCHGQCQRWSGEKYPCRASGGLAACAWPTCRARGLLRATVVLPMDG